jgi:hypothetical protein
MSASAAAATTTKNVREVEEAVLEEMTQPTKKAARIACACNRCCLREEILYMMKAPTGIIDTFAKEPSNFPADEEKRRRSMRFNISAAASGVVRLMAELLPTDVRRQSKPSLPGLEFRSLALRQAYHRLSAQCRANSVGSSSSSDSDTEVDDASSKALSFNEMFQRFRELFCFQLAVAQSGVRDASASAFDDTLIERSTIVYILLQCSTGFGCCPLAFKQLRRLSDDLKKVVDELRMCPEVPTCTGFHDRPSIQAAADADAADDDTDTDVDTVPEEVQAPAAASSELQNASQDPRADLFD